MAQTTRYLREPTSEEMSGTIAKQIGGADAERAESLAGLLVLQEVAAAVLARERQRLVLKYGDDSAPVAALDEQAQNYDRLRQEAVYEADLSQQEPPAADRSLYQVHGFVRTADGAPRPRVTVALYGLQGSPLTNFSTGYTNERGYFRLQSQPAKGRVATASRLVSPAGAERSQAELPPVQLRILGSRQDALYLDPTPLQPRLGEVDFRLIILSDKSSSDCPAPSNAAPHQIGSKPKSRQR